MALYSRHSALLWSKVLHYIRNRVNLGCIPWLLLLIGSLSCHEAWWWMFFLATHQGPAGQMSLYLLPVLSVCVCVCKNVLSNHTPGPCRSTSSLLSLGLLLAMLLYYHTSPSPTMALLQSEAASHTHKQSEWSQHIHRVLKYPHSFLLNPHEQVFLFKGSNPHQSTPGIPNIPVSLTIPYTCCSQARETMPMIPGLI